MPPSSRSSCAPRRRPRFLRPAHVRGEHANLTYRVNGVLLPQPLDGFGQELDTRLIQSATLITGSLPAQFGFHTAGIVDVTTKSGATLQHNELSLYGGSFDTFQPSFQFGGTDGPASIISSPAPTTTMAWASKTPPSTYHAIHDYTNQQNFFGYFSYSLDDTSRLSLLLNIANADFQIPNTAGVATAFNLAGFSNTDSTKVNENQNQQEYYAVVAYQKNFDRLSMQLSAFSPLRPASISTPMSPTIWSFRASPETSTTAFHQRHPI